MRDRAARRMRWAPTLALALALAAALCGCAPVGVGLAADNRGAAVGLSTGLSLPTVNARRDAWQALPPPRLVDPSAADTSIDTRKAAP